MDCREGPPTSLHWVSLAWHWASSCGSKNPPVEGIHTPTHPHSSLLLNNATPHTYCISGRPPSHITMGRLSCMRVGLLVIKLVVMPLPQVLCRAFQLKALPLQGWKSTGATHCPTRSLQCSMLVFFWPSYSREKNRFSYLTNNSFPHRITGRLHQTKPL